MGTVPTTAAELEVLWHKTAQYMEQLGADLSEQPSNESVVWPLGGMATYLTTIFVLWLWMRNKPAGTFDKALRWPLVIHNYILCLFSLALVVGIGYRVVTIYTSCAHGLYAVYCGCSEAPELSKAMTFWAYLFYLSKYYELFDTVFLVLRKRPLTFLHVYHHAIVMPMCWFAINQGIIMGWITCFNNAFVHVIMYYYFAEQARGAGPKWWRKYITTIQIVQFMLDCGTSVFFGYFWYVGTPCHGTIEAWVAANAIGISFFFLFLNFYVKQYTADKRDRATKQRKQE